MTELRSPLLAQVVQWLVAAGDVVQAGQVVVILEAMKMEHAVTAPHDGVVADLDVRQGDQVTRGQRLAVVEPA